MKQLNDYPERFANLNDEFLPAKQEQRPETVVDFSHSNARQRLNHAQQAEIKAEIRKTENQEAKARYQKNNTENSLIRVRTARILKDLNPVKAGIAFLFFGALWLLFWFTESRLMQPIVENAFALTDLPYLSYTFAGCIFVFYELLLRVLRRGHFPMFGQTIHAPKLNRAVQNGIFLSLALGCLLLFASFIYSTAAFRVNDHELTYRLEQLDLQRETAEDTLLTKLDAQAEQLLSEHLNGSDTKLLYFVMTLLLCVVCGYCFQRCCFFGLQLVSFCPTLRTFRQMSIRIHRRRLQRLNRSLSDLLHRRIELREELRQHQETGVELDVAMCRALAMDRQSSPQFSTNGIHKH